MSSSHSRPEDDVPPKMLLTDTEKSELTDALTQGSEVLRSFPLGDLPQIIQDISSVFEELLGEIQAERFALREAFALYFLRDKFREQIEELVLEQLVNELMLASETYWKWEAIRTSMEIVANVLANVADRLQLRSDHRLTARMRKVSQRPVFDFRWYGLNEKNSGVALKKARLIDSRIYSGYSDRKQALRRTADSIYHKGANPSDMWKHLGNIEEMRIGLLNKLHDEESELGSLADTIEESIYYVLSCGEAPFEITLAGNQRDRGQVAEEKDNQKVKKAFEVMRGSLKALRSIMKPLCDKVSADENARLNDLSEAAKVIKEWNLQMRTGGLVDKLVHHTTGRTGDDFEEPSMHALEALRDLARRLRDVSMGDTHRTRAASLLDLLKRFSKESAPFLAGTTPAEYQKELRKALRSLLGNFTRSWKGSVTMSLGEFESGEEPERSKPGSIYRLTLSGEDTVNYYIQLGHIPENDISFSFNSRATLDISTLRDTLLSALSKRLPDDAPGLRSLLTKVQAHANEADLDSLVTRGGSIRNEDEIRTILSAMELALSTLPTCGREIATEHTVTGERGKSAEQVYIES